MVYGHDMKTIYVFFFFSSRRRHTRLQGDWSSDVCSSDLWSSAVMRLPKCVLANPHCGERHRFSSGTNFAAASMRRFSSSFDSSFGFLVLTRPSTTFLFFGTKRRGSKPPARSVSYSRKNPSTAVPPNTVSATGSYPPEAIHMLM